MKRFLFVPLSAVLAAGLAAAVPAGADESSDLAVKIAAPLEAAECSTVPPTLTVLTLNVDVTNASFESESEDDGEASSSCASLVPGAGVEIKLLDDSEPLEATEVEEQDEGEAEIQAPVQAVDPAAQTVTLLGLTIDASGATIEGDDDDGEDDDGSQTIDLSQIVIGQSVEVELDPARLPMLVATKLEVKNFANQVSVEVDDDSGSEIEDESGEVTVSVDQTVLVRQASLAGAKPKLVKRTVHLQFQARGSFVVTGLARGRATIRVERIVDGVKTAARRVVRVQPNKSRAIKMRLHKTRS